MTGLTDPGLPVDPPFDIRAAKTDEIPFIYDSWIKGWRESRWAGCVPNNRIVALTKDVIHALVARGALLTVAVRSGRVLGWCCTEVAGTGETVIHAAYVKAAYRAYNVFDILVGQSPGSKPGFYTHRTDYLDGEMKGTRWRHAPEIARRK